jgi:hypothetical protein
MPESTLCRTLRSVTAGTDFRQWQRHSARRAPRNIFNHRFPPTLGSVNTGHPGHPGHHGENSHTGHTGVTLDTLGEVVESHWVSHWGDPHWVMVSLRGTPCRIQKNHVRRNATIMRHRATLCDLVGWPFASYAATATGSVSRPMQSEMNRVRVQVSKRQQQPEACCCQNNYTSLNAPLRGQLLPSRAASRVASWRVGSRDSFVLYLNEHLTF